MNPLERPINNMLAAIERAKPYLLRQIGAQAVLFTLNNFRLQKFNAPGETSWQKRAKTDKGRPGRNILVDSGHLQNSIHDEYHGDTVRIATGNIPYAKIHNEGGDIRHPSRQAILSFKGAEGSFKLAKTQTESQQRKITTLRRGTIGAHVTHMPRRHFLGPSPVLDEQIKELLVVQLQK